MANVLVAGHEQGAFNSPTPGQYQDQCWPAVWTYSVLDINNPSTVQKRTGAKSLLMNPGNIMAGMNANHPFTAGATKWWRSFGFRLDQVGSPNTADDFYLVHFIASNPTPNAVYLAVGLRLATTTPPVTYNLWLGEVTTDGASVKTLVKKITSASVFTEDVWYWLNAENNGGANGLVLYVADANEGSATLGDDSARGGYQLTDTTKGAGKGTGMSIGYYIDDMVSNDDTGGSNNVRPASTYSAPCFLPPVTARRRFAGVV